MMYRIKELIPAYAGVIPSAHWLILGILSYPRVCGGDPIQRLGLWLTYNLSPRMRG